jgi:ArsR family transcriptional regulator, lead/cadmium/zinc/bismuth-responsive transcriptional repressor
MDLADTSPGMLPERSSARPYERGAAVRPMTPESDTCDLLCLDLPMAEAVRTSMPSLEALEAHARAAKALADPTRLAVAHALGKSERACVCDVAWIVGRDEKLVSHHVRQLRAAGLARSERDGRMVMYELTERGRDLLGAVAV